jgi:hypothetical protein
VRVFPDAEIARRNTGFGADSVGFSDDEAGTADGAAAKVGQMPIVGKAVYGGVFAHRGDCDTVWQSKAAKLERGEEVVYGLGHIALDVAEAIWVKDLIASGGFVTGIRRNQRFLFFVGEVVVKCVVNAMRI